MSLQVHPELRRASEIQTQPQRRVSRDAPPVVDDLCNSVRRDPNSFGEMILRKTVLDQELFFQHFTGRDGCKLVLVHFHLLVSPTAPRLGLNDSPRSAPREVHRRATGRWRAIARLSGSNRSLADPRAAFPDGLMAAPRGRLIGSLH